MYMQLNATVIDSSISRHLQHYRDAGGLVDQARVQRYLDVEKALFYKAAVWLAGFHRQTERLDRMKPAS
jgi:hypothetical protein